MTMKKLTAALGWCALVNYGILLAWFLAFLLARDAFYWMHSAVLRMSSAPERLDEIHMALMGGMEILIIVFNLVPFLVLLALSREK